MPASPPANAPPPTCMCGNAHACVEVAFRSAPGVKDKPGGVARIVALQEDGTFDVKYVLGGSETHVNASFIKCHVEEESEGGRRRRGAGRQVAVGAPSSSTAGVSGHKVFNPEGKTHVPAEKLPKKKHPVTAVSGPAAVDAHPKKKQTKFPSLSSSESALLQARNEKATREVLREVPSPPLLKECSAAPIPPMEAKSAPTVEPIEVDENPAVGKFSVSDDRRELFVECVLDIFSDSAWDSLPKTRIVGLVNRLAAAECPFAVEEADVILQQLNDENKLFLCGDVVHRVDM